MFTVLLKQCSEKNIKELCKSLENNGGVIMISNNSIVKYSVFDPEFLIVSIENIKYIESDKFITITSLKKNNDTELNELTMGLSDGLNVTLSMNNTSDISVSSVSDEIVYISIQSTVFTLKNNAILPCEVALKKNEKDSLLICLIKFMILLLCDKIDMKDGEIKI